MDLIEQIDQLDKAFVLWLNHLHTDFGDAIMIFFSHKLMPIPLYAFLLFLLFKNFNLKQFFYVIIPSIILVISLADAISSKIFKPWIGRLRPCYGMFELDLPTGCGGQFGFFSSHASNSFAVAALIFLLLKDKVKGIALIVFSWAILVSFSRVYLAVHYLTDIIAGAICGLLVGALVYALSKKMLSKEYLT